MQVKDMPIAAIVAGATALMPLVQDIIDSASKGMSQDELNAKWNAMQDHFRAASAGWTAAGKTTD